MVRTFFPVLHGNHKHELMFRNRFWVCLLLTIPVLLFSPTIQSWLGYSLPPFPAKGMVGPVFAVLIFAYGGTPFLQMAVPELKQRQPGMMTLISLAITVAFAYSLFALFTDIGQSFFWEMATLIDVMLLGHWLEMRSVRQASGALGELAELMPDQAERLKQDGSTESVKVSKLQPGDLVLVRPGASVPADGGIVKGHSTLNEAMITGESQPVAKAEGDNVIGGTINGDGSLRVQVSAIGDETALAGIMRLVEEAQQSQSRTQILADQAAGWLFYIAVGAALLTAVGWSIATGLEITVAERVATVLVIACPHALGLAIPLVVAISTALGAQNGILIRDRLALEEAYRVDTLVFDKTGTLTEGRFGVADWITSPEWERDRALALASGIEQDSEHPIAQGIRAKAEEAGVNSTEVREFEAVQGRGVKAQHGKATIYFGGAALLDMLQIDLDSDFLDFRGKAQAKAQNCVYLVVDQQVVAAFALRDVVRQESQAVVKRLHEMGVEVVMITGDSKAVAEAVADELNIDTVLAEVLPEHKDERIQMLQDQGRHVAMVGDGVNDAPALTRANIGIAIGSGTDVAIESAEIILVQSNPLDVIKVFKLSRATYRKMIQNLVWATGYNVIALPLAAGVLAPIGFILSPAIGAGLMSLSTVIVAINAQFLRNLDLSYSD
ncbi:MAG: copper-translocating P-type ATPase [Chloroflexi bacterium]|nr:copper-translocating P-type ATPase [Chloroflexota bacterium]